MSGSGGGGAKCDDGQSKEADHVIRGQAPNRDAPGTGETIPAPESIPMEKMSVIQVRE
jgi:hypothetical protein